MPAAALLLPLALLAGGSLLAWLAGLLGAGSRLIAATAMVGTLAALVLIWTPQREPLEIVLGEIGAGIRVGIRLDAVSFAFAVFILTPAAFLVVFLRPAAPALAVLATATAVLTVLASGMIFAAFAWGATLLTFSLLLYAGGEEVTARSGLRGGAAWLCLVWAAAVLSGRAGTDQFTAIPVSSLQGAIFTLVALAAILGSGLLPWRPWPAELWQRVRPRIAGPAIPLFYFTGFYFLVRMYQAGGGHYPLRIFNYALVALGTACALGAALRAQAVADRSAYFGEVLPMAAGFSLIALGLGTPLGVAAAIATLATAAMLAAVLPLLGDSELSAPVLLGLLVSAGLPPSALFATRLLDLQAGLEANEVMGYLSLGGAAAWIVGVAAAARAVRLPAGSGSERPAGAVAGVGGVVLAVGGVGAGLLQAVIAVPAAAAVVSFPASALTGIPFETAAASGSWPAVAVGGVVALALVATGLAGWRSALPAGEVAPPPALLAPGWARLPERLRAGLASLTLPPELQVTGWARIDAAMARGSVWLWVALLLLLSWLVLGR